MHEGHGKALIIIGPMVGRGHKLAVPREPSIRLLFSQTQTEMEGEARDLFRNAEELSVNQ